MVDVRLREAKETKTILLNQVFYINKQSQKSNHVD